MAIFASAQGYFHKKEFAVSGVALILGCVQVAGKPVVVFEDSLPFKMAAKFYISILSSNLYSCVCSVNCNNQLQTQRQKESLHANTFCVDGTVGKQNIWISSHFPESPIEYDVFLSVDGIILSVILLSVWAVPSSRCLLYGPHEHCHLPNTTQC